MIRACLGASGISNSDVPAKATTYVMVIVLHKTETSSGGFRQGKQVFTTDTDVLVAGESSH